MSDMKQIETVEAIYFDPKTGEVRYVSVETPANIDIEIGLTDGAQIPPPEQVHTFRVNPETGELEQTS